jgi:hypothetical protein
MMMNFKRKLLTVVMILGVSAGICAQKNDNTNKRPEKNPPQVVVNKKDNPPPPKKDDKKGKP